jgi:hypothetical protein
MRHGRDASRGRAGSLDWSQQDLESSALCMGLILKFLPAPATLQAARAGVRRPDGWIAAKGLPGCVLRRRPNAGMMRLLRDDSGLIVPTGTNQSGECGDARASLPTTS